MRAVYDKHGKSMVRIFVDMGVTICLSEIHRLIKKVLVWKTLKDSLRMSLVVNGFLITCVPLAELSKPDQKLIIAMVTFHRSEKFP
jgi:hypothetical protein